MFHLLVMTHHMYHQSHHMYHTTVTHWLRPPEMAQTCYTCPHHQCLTHRDAASPSHKSDLIWPLTPGLSSRPSCRVTFLPCLSHAERWIPKRPGAGTGLARKMKHSKLVGGKECKGGEKGKKMAHPWGWLSASSPTPRLGWQRVVIAFAALALAAEDDGSGQKEERGGNQQE